MATARLHIRAAPGTLDAPAEPGDAPMPAADRSAAPPAVTRSIDLDAPADAVWDVLGDPDGLAGWLAGTPAPDDADDRGPLRSGAALDLDVDGTVRRLVVTSIEAGRSIGFVWWDLDRPDDASTVRLEVTVDTDTDTEAVIERRGRTTVTVTETLDPVARLAGGGRACLGDAAIELVARWDGRLDALLDRAAAPTFAVVGV